MHDAAFTVLSGMSSLLVLLPLPWHWKARNVGTLVNIFWLFLGNLTYFVNSIVWWDSYHKNNPIWCDITAKVGQAVGPGIICSTLCITRRLAAIASSKTAVFDAKARRTALIIDLFIGIGIPILLCAATVVSQGHRFDILEGVGCYAAEYVALPYIFLYMIWPVIITSISAGYGSLLFIRQRLQFQAILKSSKSGLDTSRFLRLMALAFSDLLLTLPLSVYLLVLSTQSLVPWVSWAHVHEDFSRIDVFPADILYVGASQEARFQLPRWLCCLGACFFFLYFGVTEDALKEYGKWFFFVRQRCFRHEAHQAEKNCASFAPTLGSHIEAIGEESLQLTDLEDGSRSEVRSQTTDDLASTPRRFAKSLTVNIKVQTEVV